MNETCVNSTHLLLGDGTHEENVTACQHFQQHVENRAPAILFMFGVCALGAFVRTVFKRAPLPYTVILLILGTLFGGLSGSVESVREFTGMASMDPHIILHSFLPVLIFESAFAIESHSFLKASLQIIILAVPGLVLASLMTAVFSMYVFDYGWDLKICMMFGAIVSATDPVAVVALLKELGASKHLGLIIEGESLLNDGAAIVVFNVFKDLSIPGKEHDIGQMVGMFFYVACVGPLFGFVMAKITILWLVNIFNDALTEITITLSVTYLTFYIGEEFLQVSGVLSVVALGLCLSAERTSISPEVEKFLHRFWEMLAYLANTLIFFLVGVVITEKAIKGVDKEDWVLILALYCVLNVIRAMVMAVFSPLLNVVGSDISWKSAVVMTWGGLRGAVSLALALMVYEEHSLDPTGILQSKVLLHTAGIVMLTLLVNATTVKKLLKALGLSEVSVAKRISMGTALKRLEEVSLKSINTFKSDRFLADADWVLVEEKCGLQNPYQSVTDAEQDVEELTSFQDRTNTCPSCDERFPCEPTKKEKEEMMFEARMRLLKGQKTSYWRQFEQGMLSREAVRKLIEVVDAASDKEDGFIDTADIKKTWQVKKMWTKLKARLEQWKKDKFEGIELPVPKNPHLKKVFDFCSHEGFELTIYGVVFINIIMIFIEFGLEADLRCEGPMKLGFNIVNYIFIVIYVLEALLKIMAFRKYYFKDHWNNFDLVILALSFVDVALDETIFAPAKDCADDGSGAAIFNPSFLKLAKIAKVMRLLRILRGLKTIRALIPTLLRMVNERINVALRFGYDVGKGYVMGEEDVFLHIPLMVDNKEIANTLRDKVNAGRIEIMRELGLLQKEHPGIAVSVKTQQATRRILNTLRDKISILRGEGVLDELEAHKIELMVEKKMKKLLKMPPTMPPPPPERVIGNLPWIKGDDLLMEYITNNAELVSMQEGETLFCEGDPQGGIYIVVSGLIKVDGQIIDLTESYSAIDKVDNAASETDVDKSDRIFDYLTTGSVLGEVSLLTNQTRRANVTCETSTQLYHINYEAIQSALELFTDPPTLEYKLWLVCALRLAAGILKRHYTYKIWPMERIKIYLEKSTMYLHHYDIDDYHYGSYTGPLTTFEIKPLLMSDVILIHGTCDSTTMGHKYTGPCYIPLVSDVLQLTSKSDRHVLLILPRGSSIGLTTVSDKVGNQSVTSLPKKPTSGSLCLRHSSLLRAKLSTVIKSRTALLEKHSMDKIRPLSAFMNPSNTESRRASMFGGLGRQKSNDSDIIQNRSGRISPLVSTVRHQNPSYDYDNNLDKEISTDSSFYNKTLNITQDVETGNSSASIKKNQVKPENNG